MQIIWEEAALADLQHIRAYIANDNPIAARQVAANINQTVGRLVDHPDSGRAGRVADTRELIVPDTPYIAAYQVSGDTVLILRVLHGARKWPEHFGES
jgi:addiction module RelE/StbE family toxin